MDGKMIHILQANMTGTARRFRVIGRRRGAFRRLSGNRSAAMPSAVALAFILSLAAIPGALALDPSSNEPRRADSDGGRIDCAPLPSRCGYPDSTNTGVKPEAVLQRIPDDVAAGEGWHFDPRGWIVIDGNGTRFENFETNARIEVSADDVSISNVRINEVGDTFGIGLRSTDNTRITDSEIGSPNASNRLEVGIKDVYGNSTNTVVARNEIFHTSTGVQIAQGLIEDNYIHSMALKVDDHVNGTTSNGSTVPMIIRHNTIFNQLNQTDAISLFPDFGQEGNRLIEDNLMAGGSYVFYGGDKAGYPAAFNIRVIDNRFSRIFYPDGGVFGPVTGFNSNGQDNVWSGNVWDDTNLEIPPPR